MGPWWIEAPEELATLESGLPPEYQNFERVAIGRALVYRGDVSLDPLPPSYDRRLALVFKDRPSRARPVVMADGPRTKRHRFSVYRPLPLCLWYAGDPPEQQWSFERGIAELIDIARVHLVREARFRHRGEKQWRGPEKHLAEADIPLNRALRRALERRGPRAKCWCGSRLRYIRCHGEVSEERELAILGLLGPIPANATSALSLAEQDRGEHTSSPMEYSLSYV